MNASIPRIGIGVFLLRKNGSFVAGARKGSHGAGTWALPGGHLEYGETFEECAKREVLEETGIPIETEDIKFLTATNTVFNEGKHYVTIFTACWVPDETVPKLLEPEKCTGWEWVKWEDMKVWKAQEDEGLDITKRRDLFKPMKSLMAQRPGFSPDSELKSVSERYPTSPK